MAMARDEYDYYYLLKIVLLGDLGVGKSSLLLRFADNTFTEWGSPIYDLDFKVRTVDVEGKKIKLQIWKGSRLSKLTYFVRDIKVFLLCFDLTDEKSFHNIRNWIREVAQDFVRILVGLKTDLGDERVIEFARAQALADEYDIPYFECSAKTGANVEKMFLTAASLALEAINKPKEVALRQAVKGIPLGKTLLKILDHNHTLLNVDIDPSDLLSQGEQPAMKKLLVRNRGLVGGAVADSKENKKEDKDDKRRSAVVVEKPALPISHSESKREVAPAVKEVKNNPFAFDWSLLTDLPEPLAVDEIPPVPPEAKKPEPIPNAAAPQRHADIMSPHLERKAEQKLALLSPILSNESEQAQYAACIAKLKTQIQQPPPTPAEQWQSLQPSLRELEERLFRLDAAGEPWAWAPTDPAPAPSIPQPEPLPLVHSPAPPAAPRGHMVFLPPPSVQQSGSAASSNAATTSVSKKLF